MKQNLSVKSVLLFLGFSYFLTCAAVPTARSLNLVKSPLKHLPALPDFQADQEYFSLSNDGQVVAGEGHNTARRMGIELADYPGTGANNNHDPKPPAGV